METMKVKLSQLMPNPHRDFERNPLSEERVEKFMESIKDNGFWENIVGRLIPNTLVSNPSTVWQDKHYNDPFLIDDKGNIIKTSFDGGYPLDEGLSLYEFDSVDIDDIDDKLKKYFNGGVEIAYGHHRIEALKRLYGNDYEFDIRIRDFNNVQMYHVMIAENDEYGINLSDTIDEAVAEAKKMLENDLNLAKEYGDIDRSQIDPISRNRVVGAEIITRFMQQRKKGEKENRKSSWNLSKVQRSLARMSALDSGKLSHEAIRELPSETHASEFARALNDTDFTEKEQKDLAKEISTKDLSKREVKGFVEAKEFEKKYPRGKKETKTDPRVLTFEKEILNISDDIGSLSDKFLKLKSLSEEIKNISTKDGIENLEIFFASIGSLQRRINKFLDVMSENTELTQDNINSLKQLQS